MSTIHDAIAWAIAVSKGQPMQARMVLIVGLAPRVNDDFIVWPSINLIADDTDMSRSSVKRWMKHLVAEGMVEKFERHRESGAQTSNSYRLPIRTVHIHPKTGLAVGEGGGFNLNRGGVQSEPGPGPHGEPPRKDSLKNKTNEEEEQQQQSDELDLGLPPLPSRDPSPQEVAEFIEPRWAAIADIVQPMRGGKMIAKSAEKAKALGKEFAIDGEGPLETWAVVFERISRSDWLQGKVPSKDGRSPFRLAMSWLLEKRNFEKVLEGRYDGQFDASGRRGSTSEATSRVLARIRAGNVSGADRGNQRRIEG